MSKQLKIDENNYNDFIEYITDYDDYDLDIKTYAEDKCSRCDHYGSCDESDTYARLNCSGFGLERELLDDEDELHPCGVNRSVTDRLRDGE